MPRFFPRQSSLRSLRSSVARCLLGFAFVCPGIAGLGLASAQTEDSEDKEETPGPGSEESSAFVALPPPLLRPPPGLEFAPDSPASRASLHLHRAAAIQPLTEHLVTAAASRFVTTARGPLRPEPQVCAEAEAIRRLLSVAQGEFEAELATALALLESVSSEADPVRVLRDRSEALTAALRRLRPQVRYVRRQTKRWSCQEHGFDGLVGLELSSTPAELAGRALLVQATERHRVLWLDGIPVAVSGDQAWGLVLLQRSGQTLCESDARATYCRGGREIMGLSSAYLPLAAP